MMAHRRLAIQDLSALGHQPMWSRSKRYCIVFNGEIYNFKELSDTLISEGNHFSGHSDTEVLLCAIENWGIYEAIRCSVGMFAFGLWDSKDKTLSLCRDRMGEKPLYYGWINSGFCFASELKAIESISTDKPLELDHQGLMKFTRYGYITAPDSIYKHIYKLMPGTIFTFNKEEILEHHDFSPHADKSNLCPKTYWSVYESAASGLNDQIDNDAEACEELESLLEKTVNRQIVADVNVGVFLSGGIDSSTIAALTQKVSSTRIKTFSIGFEEQEYDESRYAAAVAKHLGTDHMAMNVSSQDTLNTIPDLPSIYDEPFADSSQIPMFIVSKFARNEVTVCLSGDGGDELFAGYNRYLSTQNIWKKLAAIPKPIRQIAATILTIPKPSTWDALYNLSQLNKGLI
jgi:asparagine synthase (glutamine-hydrolysing)